MHYSEENDLYDDARLVFEIGDELSGTRLDKAASELVATVSRSRIADWIARGAVSVNAQTVRKPSRPVYAGDVLEILEQPSPEALSFAPFDVAFETVYEDADVIVVNKPADLVTHPANGHWTDTLLNGLLFRHPELACLARAGIVHRLDKDTTGLMVVARNASAAKSLVEQLSARAMHRQYWAVVAGRAPEALDIDKPIERDPANPLRFRVSKTGSGRSALTHVRRVARSGAFSLCAMKLETGRTHQIRVHLSDAGLPIAGDPLYRHPLAPRLPEGVAFTRQALHAARLHFQHPADGRLCRFFAPPPADFLALTEALGLTVDLDEPDYYPE